MAIAKLASGVFFEAVDDVSGRINPAAVTTLFVVGITERGPIGEAPLVGSFAEWQRIYGGYTVNNADVIGSVKAFYDNGGLLCRASRVTHCTSPGDPSTTTSAAGTLDLDTDAVAASAGYVESAAQPFDLEPGYDLVVAFEAGGDQTFTVTAVAASVESAAEPFVLADAQTFIVDGFTKEIDVTEFADITNATAEEVVNVLNPFFLANSIAKTAILTTGNTKVKIQSTQRGSGASFTLAGTALAGMGGTFSAGTITGTGNVANVDSVTAAEIAAIASGITNGSVSSAGGKVRFTSATTGASSTAQVKAASTADTAMGFDNAVHSGSSGAAVATWTVDGRYDGEYANALSVRLSDPTNGDSLSANLEVLKSGVVVERFFNVSADPASARFVETIVNDEAVGSQLIVITDLGATLPPANGTFGPLTGGDDGLGSLADADYLGSTIAGPPPAATGMRVFDAHDDGDLIIVPGRATAAVQEGVIAYCEVNRDGKLFFIADPPADQSAAQMATYVSDTATLFDRTELAAIYWPRVKVVNPDTEVYEGTTITIPPSGILAGLCARVDSAKTGGPFDMPAGSATRYLPVGILGFETATGESPTLTDRQRLFPKNVNCIIREQNGPIFVDGARTLSITGNFPSVGQSRGVIFVKKRVEAGLSVLRHRPINTDLYAAATRIVTAFLAELCRAGAFASRNPADAFLVSFAAGLNPPAVQAAREVHGDLGLATSVPAEFIVLRLGPLASFLNTELALVA